VATEDGFVIALVYGSRTNWLQNVLARGSATLVHEGQTYEIDQPEIVPIGRGSLLAGDQRGFVACGRPALRLVRRRRSDSW
jgi:hypothetical protein